MSPSQNISSAPQQQFTVSSPNVTYSKEHIKSNYVYRDAKVAVDPHGQMTVTPTEKSYDFKVERNVPKTGWDILL